MVKIKFKTSENVKKYSNSILCTIKCAFAGDRLEQTTNLLYLFLYKEEQNIFRD